MKQEKENLVVRKVILDNREIIEKTTEEITFLKQQLKDKISTSVQAAGKQENLNKDECGYISRYLFKFLEI